MMNSSSTLVNEAAEKLGKNRRRKGSCIRFDALCKGRDSKIDKIGSGGN